MPDLPPATLAQKMLSQVTPKRLIVRMRTRSLSEQTVSFTPVFTIDNLRVAPDLITPHAEQTILGYHVRLSADTWHIVRTTKCNSFTLERGEAADFISQLSERGIAVISDSGAIVGPGQKARLTVDISLLPEDRLEVKSTLALPSGKPIPKPSSVQDIYADKGWMPFGDSMVKLGVTGTRLDQILFEDGRVESLEGRLVPQFLKRLFAYVEAEPTTILHKSKNLEGVTVRHGDASPELRISGDQTAIRAERGLRVRPRHGATSWRADDEVMLVPVGERAFFRTKDGWLEVASESIADYRRARETLPASIPLHQDLVGPDIPIALAALRGLTDSAWGVGYDESITTSHQLLDAPPTTTLILAARASGQVLEYSLTPVYLFGAVRVGHDELGDWLRKGSEWVSRDGAWIKPCRATHEAVERFARTEGLAAAGNHFVVSAVRRDAVRDSAGRLGTVLESAVIDTPLAVDIDLVLNGDASLNVVLCLRTADGREIHVPDRIDAIRKQGGFFASNGEIHRLPPLSTELDTLFASQGRAELRGRDVPILLKAIARQGASIAHLTKNDRLQYLDVAPVTTSHRLRIVGNESQVTVESRMVMQVPRGGTYEAGFRQLENLGVEPSDFIRVAEGWVEVQKADIERFFAVRSSIADRSSLDVPIHGTAIPEALLTLRAMASNRQLPGITRIDVTKEVAGFHKALETSGKPEFIITVEAEDGFPQASLSVHYRHDDVVIPHEAVARVISDGARWVRQDGRWFAVDKSAYDRVVECCEQLGLYDVGSAFRVPLPSIKHTKQELARLGRVSEATEQLPTAALEVVLRLVETGVEVSSRMLLPDGREVAKPISLEELAENGGLMVDGESVICCVLSDGPVERTLLARHGAVVLKGDDAPNLLREINAPRAGVRRISKSGDLASLAVLGGRLVPGVTVNGDADGIELAPDLAIVTESAARVPLPLEALDRVAQSGQRFARVTQGWVEIEPEDVEVCRKALDELASRAPTGTRIEGSAIPAALEAIDSLVAHGIERRIPEHIQRQHRRAHDSAPAELDLRHEASGRRPRFVLRPQYWAGESVLSHSDMARVVEEGAGWIRREDVWLRPNVEAFREVERAAEQAGLIQEGDAFLVPPGAHPIDASLFSKAGQLRSITPDAIGAGVALSVDLTPDERLMGRFHLMLDDGVAIEPSVSFAELTADEGWACLHGKLVQVQLPPVEMHHHLSQLTSDTGLTGDDVPRCFEAIQNASGSFRDIDWRGETRRLTVRRGDTACQLAVTGDQDHICLEPELVFDRDNAFDDADAVRQSDLEARQPGQTVFKRTRSGWLAAQPEIVEQFQRFVEAARRLVPVGERLEGIAIPRALEQIVPGASGRATLELHYGLRTVRIPDAIEASHRLINESAQTKYSIEIAAVNGRPVCTILPAYVHGHARLSHRDALRSADAREERARTDQGWVLIDPTAIRAVSSHAQALRLEPTEVGYLVPIAERERVHEAFSQIGQGSFSYVNAKQADLVVDLDLDDDDALRVETQLITEDGRAIPRPTDLATLHEDDRWMAVGDELFRIPTSDSDLDTDLLEQKGPLQLSGQDVPAFLARITEGATQAFRLRKNRRLDGLSVIRGVVQPSLRVSGDPLGVQIDPLLRVETQSGEMHDIPDEATATLPTDRHGYARVREGWVEIHRSALKRYRAARKSLLQIVPQGERIVGQNVPEVLRTLRQIENDQRLAGPWNVYYSEDAKEKHELVEVEARVAFQMNIVEADGQSLLHLDPTYNHKRFKFTHQEVRYLAESGQKWARRGSSWIEIDGKAFRRVEKQAKELGLQRVGDGFSFPASTRERVLPLFSAIGSVEHSKAYAEFVAKLADFTQIEELPPPGNLRPDVALRTYQQHGFNWLGFMQRFGLNGILADDMGLGKTIQTLAAIEHARERSGSSAPVLIICPTSVVHNWRAEIGKFLVKSQVVVFQGPTRDQAAREVERMADRRESGWGNTYVVTSYDIAMREKHRLSAVPWLYVVVDEGHHIKNPSAQRTHAVKTIPGQHKLVLTGTPIQNRLVELWSLFDFAMPGYLGTRSEFGKEYSTASGVNWDRVQEKLTSRIRPFVMRRLKKDVARDLPDKLTIDHEVELTPIQVALYKQVLASEDYRAMLREIDAKGVGRSQTHLFGILQRLRSVCNHPVLATEGWSLESVQAEDSAKLDYLQELLEEVVEGGHRALIFCRATQMHPILTKFLDKWGIRHLQLSGETPTEERHHLVEKFNSTDDIPVFLLSMAGSTGINLTSADTVIFYDHDWNPANDNQAMDRAYRIGQTKNVTVYRLISKGTIEERILERQRAKQALADDVIGTDAAGFKDLSKEELMGLFSLGEENSATPRE